MDARTWTQIQLEQASRYLTLRKAGCPCCRVAGEAERRCLTWFMLENYYSLGTLQQLQRGARFCMRHAAQLLEEQNNRLSATFQFLCEAECKQLNDFRRTLARESRGLFKRHPSHSRTAGEIDAAGRTCLACAAGALSAHVEMQRLLAFLATDEGRDTYGAHEQGLCRPHLWLALREAPTETTDWLAEETERRLRACMVELDLFFHRLDYRFQHEPKGAEQTAWRRALSFFWGYVDLYQA